MNTCPGGSRGGRSGGCDIWPSDPDCEAPVCVCPLSLSVPLAPGSTSSPPDRHLPKTRDCCGCGCEAPLAGPVGHPILGFSLLDGVLPDDVVVLICAEFA